MSRRFAGAQKTFWLFAKYFIGRYAAKLGKRIRRVDNRTVEAAWLRSEPEPGLGLQLVLIKQERELIEAAPAGSHRNWVCYAA